MIVAHQYRLTCTFVSNLISLGNENMKITGSTNLAILCILVGLQNGKNMEYSKTSKFELRFFEIHANSK